MFLIKHVIALIGITACFSLSSCTQLNGDEEDPAVTNFRSYLRFDTSHPNPDRGYEQSIEWLKGQAEEIGLDFHLLDLSPVGGRFALWMTWNGSDPTLKSVMLNSHMDVVTADPARWIHPPFDAFKDTEGNIYARGSRDMKRTTIAELEAIRRLKKQGGFRPLRNIHMMVMPDEEVGGERGIVAFVKTNQFKELNIGIDIDEGSTAGVDNVTLKVVYGEKLLWRFNYTATGLPTHDAFFPKFTAPQRLQVVIDRLMDFRASQFVKLSSPNVSLWNLTTVNLVRLGGGVGDNIIPPSVWALFGMRIWPQPHLNFTDLDEMLNRITEEAKLGSNSPNETVTLTFVQKSVDVTQTPVDDSNPWWTVMENTCQQLGLQCVPDILIAGSDGRHVRASGIPVFGLYPFANSTSSAHQDNEFMNEFDFMQGIDRYEKFIQNLASLPGNISP